MGSEYLADGAGDISPAIEELESLFQDWADDHPEVVNYSSLFSMDAGNLIVKELLCARNYVPDPRLRELPEEDEQ